MTAWIRKFLYPFSMDPSAIKPTDFPIHGKTPQELALNPCMQKREAKIDVIETNKFQFPGTHLNHKDEYLGDISEAPTVDVHQIESDLHIYEKEFPFHLIPHIKKVLNKTEINDCIHYYFKPKNRSDSPGSHKASSHAQDDYNFATKEKKKDNLALVQGKPTLNEADLELTGNELTRESTAKLIGLVAQLGYWKVFGHFNELLIDKYHLKQIFIGITQIQSGMEARYQGKPVFMFVMPMIILSVRIMVDRLFTKCYPQFFSEPTHKKVSIIHFSD